MPEPKTVKIRIMPGTTNATFSPNPVELNEDDSVFWSNETEHTHQIQNSSGKALTDPIPAGQNSDQVLFNDAGSVVYHCADHSGETGTIDVS